MRGVALRPVVRVWECPRGCGFKHATQEVAPHSPYHACPQFGGMEVPLVEEGTRASVRAVEREDFVGQENVRLDANGRPVMAVRVETDEGERVNVFAPVAGARLR